ncbi:transcriptional regulator with XRE-family HTH domain [Sphingobium xanthum]|uniref:helix-turn-helix domain-containing protein n=1 Tax=Sphingobium xanthum TaxID=1387165 RepID=UPI001C8BA295|nr:helix-turn-helix transcriptional regulator [Sphingobium xanthum]
MKERNRLGYRIRSQREALGVSKSEFSRQVGVTPTAVHNWEENGVVPRTDMMIEIARVLGVNASDLTGRETEEDFEVDGPADMEPTAVVDDCRRLVAKVYGVNLNQVEITLRL